MTTSWKDTYQIIDSDTLRLAENAPMMNPSVMMGFSSDRPFNNLLGKTFQFAYQWEYVDFRRSILSPYSEICVSKDLFATGSTPSGDEENFVHITFPKGNTEVAKVILLCSENNSGEWFIIYEYEKTEDDIAIELSLVNPGTAYSPATPPNNNGVYDFYNDSAREYIDLTSALQTYHNVPLSAKNIESVRDRSVLSNCVIGRDPIPVQYELSVSYGESVDATQTVIPAEFILNLIPRIPDPGFDTYPGSLFIHVPAVSAYDTLSLSATFSANYRPYDGPMQSDMSLGVFISFPADKNSEEVADLLIPLIKQNISYRRREPNYAETEDLLASPDEFKWFPWVTGEYKVLKSVSAGLATLEIKLDRLYCELPTDPVYDSIREWCDITSMNIDCWYGRSVKGKETFKSYSSYNVGPAYYDEVGRTSGVLLGAGKRVYIPGGFERSAGDRGKVANISWRITNSAPSWAKYFRMCVTESTNVLSVFPFKSIVNTEVIPCTYNLEYNGRAAVAIDCMGSGYEYVQGDYFLIEAEPNIVKPVLGFVSAIKPDEVEIFGTFIIIPSDASDVSVYHDKLFYIQRQKSKIEDAVYYEDTQTYAVINGSHSMSSGTLKCGDAWIMNRQFRRHDTAPVDETVEDFVINTMYNIRAYSKGRPMVSLKDFKQSRQQIMLWGGTHFRDTNTTEIAAFNFTDQKQLDAKFGQIHGMILAGEVLKLLQEKKETSIYVGKSVFTDAGGQVQLAQIDALFGNINSSDTDHGSSHKRTITVSDRSLYYWDQQNGSVIRSAPNGQVEISKLGFENFFLARKLDIAKAKKDGVAYDVFFGRDPAHNELLVTFKIGTYIETIVFDEDSNRWMFFADYYATVGGSQYTPDLICTNGNDAFSFAVGNLYQLEKNEASNRLFNGDSPVVIQGVLNDNPVTEKLYKNMEVDCDGVFYVNTSTPKSQTAPYGMDTYSTPAQFRKVRGKSYAPFLRNTRINSGIDKNLIYTGREMQGRIATLTVTSPTPVVSGNKFEFREMQVNWLAV